MTVPTIGDICTAIWAYPTRTLRDGTQITPATLLEQICVAGWTNATRKTTSAIIAIETTVIETNDTLVNVAYSTMFVQTNSGVVITTDTTVLVADSHRRGITTDVLETTVIGAE